MNTPQPLPPGDKPRLDALSKETIRVLCAEAMGWEYHAGMLREWTNPTLTGNRANGYRKRLPDYVTDANAALTLCDWMSERGWSIEMHRPNYISQKHGNTLCDWKWKFYRTDSGETAIGTADTAPLAITKAFLFANNLAQ